AEADARPRGAAKRTGPAGARRAETRDAAKGQANGARPPRGRPREPGMINHRCRHYRASRPCVFNKADGSECPACHHVSEYQERILFIKLDAIGDVLRSASL